jgi:NADH:ubiquinone oxidoreductase subunit 6 (subunit J)
MMLASFGLRQAMIPAALGLLGLYLLLPRPSRIPRLAGAALGIVALVLCGRLIAEAAPATPWIEKILFWSFSGLAIVGAVQLVTQHNPARGAVAFALVVINVCGLFLLNGAPFLAAGTIIIYAGAIVVTFLFVIMLCQQTGAGDADARSREPLLSCAAGAIMLGLLLSLIGRQYDPAPIDELVAAIDKSIASDKPGFENFDHEFRKFPTHLPIKETLETRSDESMLKIKAAKSDPKVVAEELAKFRAAVVAGRPRVGDIPPPDNVPLTPFAGSRTDHRLPAGNVAALGRLLFTDYIIGVEMAGTLLLVATIGAIAITYRTGRKPA